MAELQGLVWLVSPEELDRIPLDKRLLGYIRVSDVRGRGDDLVSPEIQKHSIQTLADRDGLVVVAWIYDLDKSGRNFKKRRIQETVAGVRNGSWKVVALWKWSRWGRKTKESLVYLSLVEDEAGGIVRAATEDFDPTTSVGRFSRGQMLLIAELTSDMIGDGWKEAHDQRRRAGLTHNNGPRWGYKKNGKGVMTPDPELSMILKAAYERYVAGESHRSIASDWNEQGLRTVRGGLWRAKSIGDMLDTGFAAGLIREGQAKTGNGEWKGRSIKDFGVWRKGAHDAIIDEKLWEQYKARRFAVADMPPRSRNPTQALSGVMKCGWEGCGATMVAGYSGRNNTLGWSCHRRRDKVAPPDHPANTISNIKAEAAILEWIEQESEGGEDATERAERIEAARRAVVDVTQFSAELRRLDKKLLRLTELYEDEEVNRDTYRTRKGELEAQIQEAAKGKAAAEARRDAAGINTVRQLGALRDEWHRFGAGERREALLAVTSKILVLPGKDTPNRVTVIPKWEKTESTE